VRWSAALERWVIISGERRWRATQRAGLSEIDCYFDEGDLTPSEILEQQLIENCLREDLRPIEEAEAFASLMKLNGWTGKQVAEALRVQPSRVSRALALLKLPEEIQEQVNAGVIPARSAYEISKLPNIDAQTDLAKKAAAGELSHNQAANAVRQRKGKQKATPRTTKQTFFADNGWKVIVTAPKKGTYFEIEEALATALEEVRLGSIPVASCFDYPIHSPAPLNHARCVAPLATTWTTPTTCQLIFSWWQVQALTRQAFPALS
jgi:ParB family chromosome partitioning protein